MLGNLWRGEKGSGETFARSSRSFIQDLAFPHQTSE